jgi:hypothetical protein
VNPARIAHGVGERAAADNRRCRRRRAGSGESGASGPVFGVNARSVKRMRCATAVADLATTTLARV